MTLLLTLKDLILNILTLGAYGRRKGKESSRVRSIYQYYD
jgi:hypothetical protein